MEQPLSEEMFTMITEYFQKTNNFTMNVQRAKLAEKENPGLEVKTARAEGLRDCRKLMAMAKAGKYNGYLLEGMACPGGCAAGAGTLLPVELAATVVGRYQKEADQQSPLDSKYRDKGQELD